MSTPECRGPNVRPVIDRNRCEGKAECERVCPYGIFEIGVLRIEDRAQLSFVGRMKGFFHGYRQAFMPKIDQCQGCGLCVSACPEKAISLRGVER